MITRRRFNRLAASVAGVALAAPALIGRALADDEIKIASIFDLTGGLDIYGKPTNMALTMAIEEINAAGGLGGKKVSVVTYDTQSNMQLYAQFAQQAALQDKVALVHGAITSASREVIRPILHRFKTPLLYSTQYEGGVCDSDTFCTGSTPTMQVKASVEWAIKRWGKKFVFIGADYNAPRITAAWASRFAKEAGGEAIGNEFFPLDVTEFGPVITKIQQLKPDFLISELVGAAHIGFYRQWSAAGMLSKIPQLSYTFGVGNENTLLPPADTEGIVAAYTYFEELDTPANKDFVARFKKRFGADAPSINCVSIGGYEGTMVWAEAVRKGGGADRASLSKGWASSLTYNGPAGSITTEGKTHHVKRDVYMGQIRGGKWNVIESFPQQAPVDDEGQCDLQKSADMSKQFSPKL